MNEINLVCNRTSNRFHTEEMILKTLSSFIYFDNIKLCHNSVIIKYGSYDRYSVEYEIEPDMTPEILFNYWRLIHE